MKPVILLLVVPSIAMAQSVLDYRSPFEIQPPEVTAVIAAQAANEGQGISTPGGLLPPLDARPTYPTTVTPLGTPANGYIINSPNAPTITCIPQVGGNMSCY